MSNKKANELNNDIQNNKLVCSSDLSDEYSFAVGNKNPDKIVSFKPTTKLRLKLIQPTEQEQITREKLVKFYTDIIQICSWSDEYYEIYGRIIIWN